MPSIRVVMRWKLQAVVRSLEAWRELTAEEVRKRNVMQRIVSRMLHRSLSFAMDLWQRSVSAARQERVDEERRRAVMSRIVKRMLNQAQAAAFERWTSNVIELARQRNIMDRILRRMLSAKIAGGQTAFGRVCVSV
jgi:FixJ family two-component response regulator